MGSALVPERVVPMGMGMFWCREATLGMRKGITWGYQVEDMVVMMMVV